MTMEFRRGDGLDWEQGGKDENDQVAMAEYGFWLEHGEYPSEMHERLRKEAEEKIE